LLLLSKLDRQILVKRAQNPLYQSVCNRAGIHPISQPEKYWMLTVSHEFELGDSTYAVAKAIDYNYVGEFFATSSNDPLSHIDSQGFVNRV